MTTKLEPMTIKIPEKLHNDLREHAFKRGEFLYQTAERLLQNAIKKEKEGKENG